MPTDQRILTADGGALVEGLGDPLIHVDHHALVLADGIVALLDAMADPLEEGLADDL